MKKTLTRWSIDLGFYGELSPNFFEKLKKVKKVRKKLKTDLIIYLFSVVFFLYLTNTVENFILKVMFFGFMVMSMFATYRNIKIWVEIFNIQDKRQEEYKGIKGLKIKTINVDDRIKILEG